MAFYFYLFIFRVKPGKFGHSAKFGQRPCFFDFRIIGIKIKLTKQTVKNPMRFSLFANVCPNLPAVRSHLTLPYRFPLREIKL